MSTKIGEAIARTRNVIKASKQDAFLTDRYIYSLIKKHGSLLMRRQDNLNRIMKFNSIFQSLTLVELEEIDSAEGECFCITSGCMIRRTKQKLPAMLEGYYGPLIRTVTSLDYSEIFTPTYPTIYRMISKQKSFKYNKHKYYWYMDGYIYFPNTEFDAVRIDGVFDGDISHFNCDETDDCIYVQDKRISIPDFLFSEIDEFIKRDLNLMVQVPTDTQHDNKNTAR